MSAAYQARCPVEEQQNEAVVGAHLVGLLFQAFRSKRRGSFETVSKTAETRCHVRQNSPVSGLPPAFCQGKLSLL